MKPGDVVWILPGRLGHSNDEAYGRPWRVIDISTIDGDECTIVNDELNRKIQAHKNDIELDTAWLMTEVMRDIRTRR